MEGEANTLQSVWRHQSVFVRREGRCRVEERDQLNLSTHLNLSAASDR